MTISAGQLAKLLDGKVNGNPEVIITHPAPIEDADSKAVTFLANPKYASYLDQTKAAAVIVSGSFNLTRPDSLTFIVVEDAYRAFTRYLQMFARSRYDIEGIHSTALVSGSAHLAESAAVDALAVISDGAVIGEGARIGAGVFIGKGVKIGAGSVLHPGVVVYHDCIIGARCVIHSNTVIGSDGFGFAPQPDGSYEKIPQLGQVLIGDDVEIGANCAIDRATMGATRIGKGVKIDNLVQIAHNVVIGDHTVIAAQAGISGSARIGRYCRVGGQAGFVGHIEIADRSGINAQAGVSKSVKKEGAKLTGSPAWDYQKALRAEAVFRRLPELEEKIRNLEKIINSQAQEKKG